MKKEESKANLKSAMAVVDQLIAKIEEVMKSLPVLPTNIKEVIVKVAPWLSLIFGVLGILGGAMAIFAAIGLTALTGAVAPVAGVTMGYYSLMAIVMSILGIFSSVLTLMAVSGLKAQKMVGWKYLFYSELVSVVSMVLTLNVGSIVFGAVFVFIYLYFLFQVKSYYK